MPSIHISPDRLQAFLGLEEAADFAQVEAELEAMSIVHGVDWEAVRSALTLEIPFENICIATGTPPVARTAARVELAADQNQISGRFDEASGQMDFRERGGVHSVHKDELVGIWYPGTDGTPGRGVDGLSIDPPAPETTDQSRGANLLSELGKGGAVHLISEIDGVVRIGPAGDVYVTEVFEVHGDVDLNCGNIEVTGSVYVSGTVRSGFRVHAGQDVRVDEAIEDADVKAGQSLHVGAGILAGDNGMIQANDLIQAKFAQNATLRSGGDVILEVDTNSTIEAADSILAKDGAGHLRGGHYLAGQSLVAKELGSNQGVATRVQVGFDPGKVRELARVRSELMNSQASATKLQRERGIQSAKRVGQALTRDHANAVRRSMKAQRELQKAIASLESRQKEIEVTMAMEGLPLIRVEKTVHAGVHMQIGNAHLSIDQTRPGGTFRRDPETGKITQS